jgi:hypothetical protein
MTVTAQPKPSSAFFLQAGLSFGVALAAVSAGIAYLPVNG